MQEIITVSGKIFQVYWCAASVDGVMKFQIVPGDTTMREAFDTFSDPNETAVLTLTQEHTVKEYSGFTYLQILEHRIDDSFNITLRKEG